MSNGGDAAEQIIRISLDGVDYAIRIAGTGAKNLISLLMALAKSKKNQPPNLKPSGKERLKRMIKSGRPLDVFPVREQDIRAFTQEAKKYGIVYCAVRDKEPKADGMVDVLVRKEDSPKINRVMERLQYATVDKTSIKSEIVKNKSEKGVEPAVPDKSDNLDVDSFLILFCLTRENPKKDRIGRYSRRNSRPHRRSNRSLFSRQLGRNKICPGVA